MKTIRAAFIAALCFAGADARADWHEAADGSWTFRAEPEAVPAKNAVTIPPGMHAHTRTDGTTFIHGDENLGDPVAHTGVARPWPKTGRPGEIVLVDAPLATKSPACACGERCPCISVAAPVAASPVVSGHWERQRVGIFRSRDVWVSDAPAVPAVQYSPAVTYTLPTSGSSCPGGVCPPTRRR